MSFKRFLVELAFCLFICLLTYLLTRYWRKICRWLHEFFKKKRGRRALKPKSPADCPLCRPAFNCWVGGQRAIADDAFPTASHQTGPASLKAPSFPVIQLSVNPRTIISTISNLLMAGMADDESFSSLGNHALYPNRFFNPPLPAPA